MTTPANPPSAAVLHAAGVGSPVMSTPITATTAYDLTDKTHWKAPFATEIYFSTAGTFTGQLAGDAAAQAYVVVAGQVLKGAWVLIPAGNALACIARYGA